MRISFVAPELPRLDRTKSDAISLFLHQDDWPLRGTPGLVDWRVGGHLSRLRERGWITCDTGETLLMPLGRRFPFEKLFLVGMGPAPEKVDEDQVAALLHHLFETLEKMKVYATILQLPGRPLRLPPERVISILLNVAEDHPNHDEVVLVEPLEAQQEMQRLLKGIAEEDPSTD